MEQDLARDGGADELVGALFTTPKELRHLAEQSLGQLFVPTEVVHAGERAAILVLRPAGQGRIVVHAQRERPGYPFNITRVERVAS
ncbi:MAG TPA: hypothetical protein VFQ39_12965 [Longimicrobium sp.]|nr:hypothetical protein [Longimicrobium sp.]